MRALIASLAMGAVAIESHSLLQGIVEQAAWGVKAGQAAAVLGSIAAGLAVYGILALFLCRREVHELLGRRHRSSTPVDVA